MFSQRSAKIDKHLFTNIRNKTGNITVDFTYINWIIRTMNNFMPINLTTKMKSTSSVRNTAFRNGHKYKLKYSKALTLSKKLNSLSNEFSKRNHEPRWFYWLTLSNIEGIRPMNTNSSQKTEVTFTNLF